MSLLTRTIPLAPPFHPLTIPVTTRTPRSKPFAVVLAELKRKDPTRFRGHTPITDSGLPDTRVTHCRVCPGAFCPDDDVVEYADGHIHVGCSHRIPGNA